jgi:DNA-binding response OmpR family regulator
MPESVLVVEAGPALPETLAYNLSDCGYKVETAGELAEISDTDSEFWKR